MKLTGCQILIECLKKQKVELMFGIPGGTIIDVFDAIYDCGIKFVLTRHEQGATHMADGYARATGKTGVVITTSGPGATNTVTGIATAYMDSIPMVIITGQVPTSLIGNDAFQESDIVGITRSITKHNFLVKDIKDLARTLVEAFHIASTGRPGPVLVDLPKDVQKATCEFEYPEKIEIRSYKPTYQGHPMQIKKAQELINTAKKPILYIGGGVIISGAHKEVLELAEKANIPVTMTFMGLGAFPMEHPLSLGMLGMHGTYYANHSVQKSDTIIAIGARFDDRVTGRLDNFAPNAKFIHIDIDPTSISKNVAVDVPVVGDAKNILPELIKGIKPVGQDEDQRKEWFDYIKKLRIEGEVKYKDDDELRPQYVVEKISELTKGEAVICTEVGQNQMWAAQYYRFKLPRTWISSGGLGTMGYGFPAAIGAKMGVPDKIVFDIAGDGSIQMNIQELSTAVRENLDLKIVILNNGYLGLVRQWQYLFYNKRYSSTILENGNPDFVKLAEAYGATGIRILKKKDVEGAIKKALEIKGVVVLDFHIVRDENVFPFVPAGKALDEVLRGLA